MLQPMLVTLPTMKDVLQRLRVLTTCQASPALLGPYDDVQHKTSCKALRRYNTWW